MSRPMTALSDINVTWAYIAYIAYIAYYIKCTEECIVHIFYVWFPFVFYFFMLYYIRFLLKINKIINIKH